MPQAKDKYHHGDLRQMLIDAGIAFLKDHPASKLSVRTLARGLGVSEAAPYHHFADRQAFEQALMLHGYQLLQGYCETTIAANGGLLGILRIYVGFALEHRNLYRLIHRSGEARNPEHKELHAQSQAAFDPLLIEVRHRGLAAGVSDPKRIGFLALMVWTQVHGLTEVVLDDFLQLGEDQEAFCQQAYAYIDASLQAALNGTP